MVFACRFRILSLFPSLSLFPISSRERGESHGLLFSIPLRSDPVIECPGDEIGVPGRISVACVKKVHSKSVEKSVVKIKIGDSRLYGGYQSGAACDISPWCCEISKP